MFHRASQSFKSPPTASAAVFGQSGRDEESPPDPAHGHVVETPFNLDSTSSAASAPAMFLEPPTTMRPRRRQHTVSSGSEAAGDRRSRTWLGRRFVTRSKQEGSSDGDDDEEESSWGAWSSRGAQANEISLLPSHTPPLNGSRPPSRSKRRRDRDEDRSLSPYLNMDGILSHPSDRRPINIRQLPSRVFHPRNISHTIRTSIIRQPWIAFYILGILLVGLSPLTVRFGGRKSYAFLVRPYPEPTDVMAFMQKFVFTRGGALYRWTSNRYHRNWNRHFMWEFPIQELINAKGPEEFDSPKLRKPERRKRRSLGEYRPEGWEEAAEPLSGWESEAFPVDAMAKPSRTMAPRTGWRRDLAAGIPLDDAAHRSDFFHELYANTSLHHYKDDLDLISPAFLALHTFSTAGSPAARAERDLVRRYQRSRIPREFYHLIDFQFVICSPFGVHEYGYHLDPKAKSNIVGGGRGRAYRNWGPIQQRRVWEELKAEQEEFGDILIVDEMEIVREGGGGKAATMKENMDYGKTYGWMREVVRRAEDGRGREAMFVMKTDADAYHILPNLLRFLLDYDPSKAVYVGSTLGTHYAANQYMQGLGYGFSWPLLQSLVHAELPASMICGFEDHITGSWMYSLPASRRLQTLERTAKQVNSSYIISDTDLHLQTFWSPDAPSGEGNCIKAVPETCIKPLIRRQNDRKMPRWVTRYARLIKHSAYEILSDPNALARKGYHLPIAESDHDVDLLTASDLSAVIPRRIIPDSLYAYDPPSPDPYTGLIRADMYERAGSWWYWWVPKTERLITAHGMKTRKEFLDAYEKLEAFWLRPKWIGQRANAVPYLWDPPDWLKKVGETMK